MYLLDKAINFYIQVRFSLYQANLCQNNRSTHMVTRYNCQPCPRQEQLPLSLGLDPLLKKANARRIQNLPTGTWETKLQKIIEIERKR